MDDTTHTLLYTANLRGDLALLPKLYTFLKLLTDEFNPVYIVDLGESCSPNVWHCDATDARSMLIAFDGMGYTAANATELTLESRQKLSEPMTMGLVDEQHPCVVADLLFALSPMQGDGHLCVILSPAEVTRLEGRTLSLQRVAAGQVGIVRVLMEDAPKLLSADIRQMPPDTPPTTVIAGVVDFIVSEARYYQKRKSENS